MPTELAFNKLFKACDATLRAAYAGSSVTSTKQAKTRTCTNREALVQDLFERMLPVATRTIHGAVFIDARGGESGDVDVAVVAPWGAPVWPFQAHPLVPCEGVIAGVFCEVANPARNADVWRQVRRARSLFKSVSSEDAHGHRHRTVPRGRTPNLGIWCWDDAPGPVELASLMDGARNAREDENLLAKARERCPVEHVEGYAERVLAVGAHTPNWIYWHGTRSTAAQFAFRVHRRAREPWNTADVMPGLRTADCSETKIWTSASKVFEWKYVVVSGEADDARPLKALVAYLSTQVVLYGHEVPHYGAYANGRGQRPGEKGRSKG